MACAGLGGDAPASVRRCTAPPHAPSAAPMWIGHKSAWQARCAAATVVVSAVLAGLLTLPLVAISPCQDVCLWARCIHCQSPTERCPRRRRTLSARALPGALTGFRGWRPGRALSRHPVCGSVWWLRLLVLAGSACTLFFRNNSHASSGVFTFACWFVFRCWTLL